MKRVRRITQKRKSPLTTRKYPQREKFLIATTDEEAARYIKLNTEFRLPSEKKKLDLSNKNIQALPLWLGKLTDLKQLFLSENQLTSIPQDLFKRGAFHNLEFLDLSKNQLRYLPSNLFKDSLPNLRYLDISINSLTSLPSELFKNTLPSLQYVYLGNNQLSSIPESLLNRKEVKIYGVDEQIILSSPKRRSPSPKRRSPSLKRRSPSLKRRSPSPKRRSPSL